MRVRFTDLTLGMEPLFLSDVRTSEWDRRSKTRRCQRRLKFPHFGSKACLLTCISPVCLQAKWGVPPTTAYRLTRAA